MENSLPITPLPTSETNTIAPSPSLNKINLRLVLFVLIASLLIGILLFFNVFYQPQSKKTPPVSPSPKTKRLFPLEFITQGIVLEIKTNSLVVNEKSGLKKEVFVQKETLVNIQKVSLPTAKEKGTTGSAVLISKLVSNEKSDIAKIIKGDEVKIVIENKDNKILAKRITIIRKVNK